MARRFGQVFGRLATTHFRQLRKTNEKGGEEWALLIGQGCQGFSDMNKLSFLSPVMVAILFGFGLINRNPNKRHLGPPYRVRIQGEGRMIQFQLRFPQPDNFLDIAKGGILEAKGSQYQGTFFIHYDYKSRFFWRGSQGGVSIRISFWPRGDGSPLWTDWDALMQGVKKERDKTNKENSGGKGDTYGVPRMTSLNGVPCIGQWMMFAPNDKDRFLYHFLLDKDHEAVIHIVYAAGFHSRNWRPKADALVRKILDTVKVSWDPPLTKKEMKLPPAQDDSEFHPPPPHVHPVTSSGKKIP